MAPTLKDVATAMDLGRTVELKLFDRTQVKRITGIRVFDVGQGDCIGLLSENDQVFCYVDYGGLGDFPQSKDTPTDMPVQHGKRLVSIILTHWDKDHYWSAKKRNPSAKECEWLVPRQMVSPQAVFLAAEIEDAKCWPERQGNTSSRFTVSDEWDIEIRKCAPFSKTKKNEDRNQTGLAVTVQHRVEGRVDSYMLIPGDCPFDRIPHLPDAPIRGLVAYHHGAKRHWKKSTRAAIANAHNRHQLAYSYGANEYGHPYRRNYKPLWDTPALTTKGARAGNRIALDLLW